MSIVTTYTCDKCTIAATSPEEHFEVSIGVKREHGGYGTPQTKLIGLWCRACVVAAGLTPPKPKEVPPIEPTTLDDLVREIVEEGIEAHA